MISDTKDDRLDADLDDRLAELRSHPQAQAIPPHLKDLVRRLERALSDRTAL
ncbi:hypothetical protein [Paracoccus liaowanqingii]|uniref:hypothetical protein n=1 Tax=Paracoccus liaowanqingii TaxID=2560053 RepID=UPI00159BDE20|nr:hypothetical protein [Paracoccus liaowanqingii]